MTDAHDKLVPIGVEPPPPPDPSPPGRMHGIAITGMALSALVGIVTMLVLTTVRWPDPTRRYVIAALVLAIVGFVVFSGAAVLTAARETYPTRGRDRPEG